MTEFTLKDHRDTTTNCNPDTAAADMAETLVRIDTKDEQRTQGETDG